MKPVFGECHAHVIMDGVNYKEAVGLHENGVDLSVIHRCFEAYQKKGIAFVRDGGDARGVSEAARLLASSYGIDYRTPVYAIHKKHHYGGIVGRGFETMEEFHALVKEAKERGADFIKIMTTGIMDFNHAGIITGTPLPGEEVKEMVSIVHGEGMSLMSHTNSSYGVRCAIEAGADSIEHGNYMDEDTVALLAKSNTIWVPTVVTIKNLLGSGRFPENEVREILNRGYRNIRLFYQYGGKAALGSDAGAYRVYHGSGVEEEYEAFLEAIGEKEKVTNWLLQGEAEIKARFK